MKTYSMTKKRDSTGEVALENDTEQGHYKSTMSSQYENVMMNGTGAAATEEESKDDEKKEEEKKPMVGITEVVSLIIIYQISNRESVAYLLVTTMSLVQEIPVSYHVACSFNELYKLYINYKIFSSFHLQLRETRSFYVLVYFSLAAKEQLSH